MVVGPASFGWVTSRRSHWLRQASQDPKGALGADLSIAVGGVVVVFFGWAIAAVGGQYRTGLKIPKLPIIGIPILVLGLAMTAFGVILALLHTWMWIVYRNRPLQDAADSGATTNDDLLAEMRERGRVGREADGSK